DASESALERWARTFPATRFTTDHAELLSDDALDAVVVATDVPSHAVLASEVLHAGKHCFVEKPLAQSLTEAQTVVDAASETQRTLMVGHLLEYHPGVAKLKEVADSGELGDVYYIYSNRLNLGKIRQDENALWSLGAHDASVLLYLFDGEQPVEVLSHGMSFVRPGVEDVVFCYLRFPSGRVAHMHLSWLDPHKERKFTVVGSKRMATFDDMALERKLNVYDKGFDPDFHNYGEYITRSGDVTSPQISNEEPLRIECRHFLDCLRSGAVPRSGPASALRVVRVLEGLQRSLDSGGTIQRLEPVTGKPA
ncbi:MAG: Gfo/Idh/MocA family oxidoreductase, partial [Dehalococcoidia bacterium]